MKCSYLIAQNTWKIMTITKWYQNYFLRLFINWQTNLLHSIAIEKGEWKITSNLCLTDCRSILKPMPQVNYLTSNKVFNQWYCCILRISSTFNKWIPVGRIEQQFLLRNIPLQKRQIVITFKHAMSSIDKLWAMEFVEFILFKRHSYLCINGSYLNISIVLYSNKFEYRCIEWLLIPYLIVEFH